jgi:hypothetical protein
MAFGSAFHYEWFCIYRSSNCFSNFKINVMIQEILALITLGIAIVFLLKKFLFKKKKSNKNCGNDDCACH